MKKICNKLAKQQWRMTVPNINTSIFKRSPSKEKDEQVEQKLSKSSSGIYDLEAAAKEYEKNGSVSKALVLENGSSESSDEEYEDARAMSERLSSNDEFDTSVYVDVDAPPKGVESSTFNEVPKISFSFFEEQSCHEYQVFLFWLLGFGLRRIYC